MKKTLRRSGMLGLFLATVLTLAACGGSGGSGGGGQGGDMQGMDHGGSGGDEQASGQAAPETTGGGDMSGMQMGETTGSGGGETTGGMEGMQGMEGMDHGSMDMSAMSREMVAPNGEYSDAAFVDAMVPHHEGAVEMAEVALENAEHEEIRALAQEIIDAQRAEIELFGEIREELGGSTTETSAEEMDQMMGMPDAGELAQARPFDRAFIDAMIPHHESAIAMAEVALEESEDPEIRRIAEDIVSSQQREIEQMRQWREEWYPEG
ncbi:DUF305 domain-containing protein (plasmid) [Rubrobacter marinus]|uniref:DUF305 domain-containing protein n=1 Tax=Rubrobacter marinus TaxID=2653852 RepID=A0A6G8Q3F2_9ACTN|nr:DUF305 domain-containing protein [Rubrobacter marinus]QIN80989.1 DUF305 domain-containing protein [Rubrobacter marinus]